MEGKCSLIAASGVWSFKNIKSAWKFEKNDEYDWTSDKKVMKFKAAATHGAHGHKMSP